MLKVLLATDGSTDALRAARFVPKLCAVQELAVTVLTVKDIAKAAVFTEGVLTSADAVVADKAAADALSRTAAALKEGGITAQERSEWGDPAEVITSVAQKEGFELIVTGSRGAHGIGGLFLGNVSDRVVHRAHCPVLVVR